MSSPFQFLKYTLFVWGASGPRDPGAVSMSTAASFALLHIAATANSIWISAARNIRGGERAGLWQHQGRHSGIGNLRWKSLQMLYRF
tara:strand:+ start:1700 stop:1960 length:261 start_codon:yes stop_codon:yes gene_type:complete